MISGGETPAEEVVLCSPLPLVRDFDVVASVGTFESREVLPIIGVGLPLLCGGRKEVGIGVGQYVIFTVTYSISSFAIDAAPSVRHARRRAWRDKVFFIL